MLTPDHDACVAILRPLWRGLDPDYKRKYSTTIWTQFEAAIIRAGRKETLSLAVADLCRKLPIAPLRDGLDGLVATVRDGEDRALLRLWQKEATTLVLMLRVEAEDAKAKAAEKAEAKKTKAMTDTLAWEAEMAAAEEARR